MNNYYCFGCSKYFKSSNNKKITFENKYGKWEGIKCPFCKGNAKEIGTSLAPGIIKDSPVAILEDNKGRQIAVNKKGNEVENIYKGDPRGYKRAGKKQREKDQYGKHKSQW